MNNKKLLKLLSIVILMTSVYSKSHAGWRDLCSGFCNTVMTMLGFSHYDNPRQEHLTEQRESSGEQREKKESPQKKRQREARARHYEGKLRREKEKEASDCCCRRRPSRGSGNRKQCRRFNSENEPLQVSQKAMRQEKFNNFCSQLDKIRKIKEFISSFIYSLSQGKSFQEALEEFKGKISIPIEREEQNRLLSFYLVRVLLNEIDTINSSISSQRFNNQREGIQRELGRLILYIPGDLLRKFKDRGWLSQYKIVVFSGEQYKEISFSYFYQVYTELKKIIKAIDKRHSRDFDSLNNSLSYLFTDFDSLNQLLALLKELTQEERTIALLAALAQSKDRGSSPLERDQASVSPLARRRRNAEEIEEKKEENPRASSLNGNRRRSSGLRSPLGWRRLSDAY